MLKHCSLKGFGVLLSRLRKKTEIWFYPVGATSFVELIKIAKYLVNGVWAIPFIIISRLVRPFVLFKFGEAQSARIGHFIYDSLLEINSIKKFNVINLWAASGISNYYWYKQIKKYINIHPSYKYLVRWNRMFPGYQHHVVEVPDNSGRDLNGIFFHNPIIPEFSQREKSIALNWLRDVGWAGEPYICILARDSKYLFELDKSHRKILDRKYHNYRNSDIDTFKKSVQFLLDKGYWVFRMGNVTEKQLKISHSKFLDYSFCSAKSDFMDIYLFSNCKALISTSTGIDILSSIRNIPTLVVNGLPLGLASTYFDMVWIPKNLYWQKNGLQLTLKEYIENSYLNTHDYMSMGIEIVDLSEEEILEGTVELVERIENNLATNNEDLQKQIEFHEMLKKWSIYAKFHSFIHPNFRIGKKWLGGINLH